MTYESILEKEQDNIIKAIESLDKYPAIFISNGKNAGIESIPYLEKLMADLRREESLLQLKVATNTISSIESRIKLTMVSSIIKDISDKIRNHMSEYKDKYPSSSDRIAIYKRT